MRAKKQKDLNGSSDSKEKIDMLMNYFNIGLLPIWENLYYILYTLKVSEEPANSLMQIFCILLLKKKPVLNLHLV